ncbi:hypothetical protein Tco_0255925 [Tanacetum coccineum]
MTEFEKRNFYCISTISLWTIDDGLKKFIKERVKKVVYSIIFPKVEKFVNDRLESEVLVRSSKEANSSHAVAANLSELELKKILIDRQFYAFANLKAISRDDIQKDGYLLSQGYDCLNGMIIRYDWITVRRDDDALYKFKEGDLHRLRIQDIEDMLLLLVQGKVTNLSVEERSIAIEV